MKQTPTRIYALILALYLMGFVTLYTKAPKEGFQAWYERTDWYNQTEFVLLLTFIGISLAALIIFFILKMLFGD